MGVTRDDGLLAWQGSIYPAGHRDRGNLLVHALTGPLLPMGCCALVAAPFVGSGWLAVAGAVGVALPVILQARSHCREAQAPAPFRGPLDVAARLFVEQWVTFPRYVLSGRFAQAWRSSGQLAEPTEARVHASLDARGDLESDAGTAT
jgi:hypothetical protein